MTIPWWGYVILAGLSWGVYVPLIFFGGSAMTAGGPAGSNSRLMAILCVGIAYFVIAVMFPLALFLTGQEEWPPMKTTGLVFSGMAGVAGAVGAICVIFASRAAMEAGKANQIVDPGFDIASYRILIAPLIFCLAPIVNTLLSTVWHPSPADPLHFKLEFPGFGVVAGVALVALGIAVVLYSKEAGEESRKKAAKAAVAAKVEEAKAAV